jgi:hypothetical protein
MSERDTQFMGFAKALWEKLMLINTSEEADLIIARSAYDLVLHAVNETIGTGDASSIPDLTELPEEQSS